MHTCALRAAAGVCLLLSSLLSAATPGGSQPIYPQIVCIVPMVGAGTLADPRRPLYAPVPGQKAENANRSKGFLDPAAITSFRSIPTDDGLFAIVIFEAHDRAAFQPILSDRTILKRFDLATTPIETLLPILRTFKRNFDVKLLQSGGL